MARSSELVFKLLLQLIREWQVVDTIEEIVRDEAKVATLIEVVEACRSDADNLPEALRDFYRKVFLQDVWSEKCTGRSPPD
jgi:hypothetical protein